MEKAVELSPEETARRLRLAAAEKRMQKTAIPKALNRRFRQIPPPEMRFSEPTPPPENGLLPLSCSGTGERSTTSPSSTPPSLRPCAEALTNAPVQETGSSPILAHAPCEPTSSEVTGDAPRSDLEAPSALESPPNPVLEAVLRRVEKNKMPPLPVPMSVRKKQLLKEITTLMESRGESPQFGLPMSTEEMLEGYLKRLKKKYHLDV